MNALTQCVFNAKPLPFAPIDMHAHMGRLSEFHSPGCDAASMVRQMDTMGIESMVCSHLSCFTSDVVFGNNEILAAMKDFPGRILGYAITYSINAKLGIEEVKRCMDNGMVGVKLHSGNKIPYDSDLYREIWEYADNYCLSVLLHTWGNMDKYERIFKDYPNVRLILGHSGSVFPEKYVEYALKYEHVFLELCYSACAHGMVEYLVRKIGSERVLFGTDCPFYSPAPQLGKVVFADISENDKKNILRLNALRILEES